MTSSGREGSRPPAVIVGIDSLQGLQTARILRDRGIPLIAVAADERHPACRTNVCGDIRYADDDALIDTLLAVASDVDARPVVVPCQDKSVRSISRHRDLLEPHMTMVLPPPDTVELLSDKIRFLEHAENCGFRVPATLVLHSHDDAVAAAGLPFPCVLKPSYRTATWDRNTKQKVFMVDSATELLDRYDECHGWADAMVVQQWIAGDDTALYSCNAYFGVEGEPLATFVARKLRQWPPGAGTSCFGEEVRDDEVRRLTLELFASVPYRGLAYLEVKKDEVAGEYYMIEANVGRPTGRSAIAEAGGVELLLTMYCDAVGLPLPAARTQTYRGAKWIDLRHDMQSAVTSWRAGRLRLRDWLRSLRGKKAYSVLSWRDPKPFLFDLAGALRMAVRRRPASYRRDRNSTFGHDVT